MSLDHAPTHLTLKLLEKELEEAQQQRDEALKRFEQLISGGAPRGISHPDYIAKIQAASQEYRQAVVETMAASDRLNRFIQVHGFNPL